MKDDEIDLDRVLYREDVRALVEKNMRAIRRLPTRYLSLYHGTKDEILNSLELKIDDCFDSQDEASLVLSCMLSSSFLVAHLITAGSSQSASDTRAAFFKATCGLVRNAEVIYGPCEEKWLRRVEQLIDIYGHPRGCLLLLYFPLMTWLWW